MEFNIEYGGELVDFDAIPRAIREVDADVVALEEAYGNTAKVARALDWPYYDARLQLVSRLPLLQPPDANGLYTLIEIEPGRVAAIGNVHLPSSPYGPRKVRLGMSAQETLELEERVRIPAVEPFLEALGGVADEMPAFLVGDFNAPSHRDWTEETAGTRDFVEFPLDWPVSRAVEQAGFVDSFRAVYPDPVQDPGITWPSGRPDIEGEWNPGPKAPPDRIDFIYAAGSATVTESTLVGEKGGEGVDVSVSPWPTDHRALVSSFDIEPGSPPTMISVDHQLVRSDENVALRWSAPAAGETQISIEGEEGVAPFDGGAAGSRDLPAADLGPGAYEAVLWANGSELARAPFWVAEPGAPPEVGTTEPSYEVGDPITVEWGNAPANRWDWIGLYKRDADPDIAYYLSYLYTEATVAGSVTFDDENGVGKWPLEPSKYTVYILIDDSYEEIAGSDFVVTRAGS